MISPKLPLFLLLIAATAVADGDPARWELCQVQPPPETPRVEPRQKQEAADISASEVSVSNNDRYELRGEVTIEQADKQLTADQMILEQEAGLAHAEGNVKFADSGIAFDADSADFDLNTDETRLEKVTYRLKRGRGRGEAAHAHIKQGETGAKSATMREFTYTTCDPESSGWLLQADEVELDFGSGRGKARRAKLSFKGVPLFYLPVAPFPLDDRRTSGLLSPTLGYNSDNGWDLALPYYFNLAPNRDATVTARTVAKRGPMLGGEYRYLLDRSSGSLQFDYMPDDRLFNADRYQYRVRHTTRMNDAWRASININEISDGRYHRDFGHSLWQTSASFLRSYVNLIGDGSWWHAVVETDRFSVLNEDLSDSNLPHKRRPRLTLDLTAPFSRPWLQGGIDSEWVQFDHRSKVTGSRADIHPWISATLLTPAYFVTPKIGLRYTSYDIDREDNPSPHRSTPIFSVDSGLIFERLFDAADRSWVQTLEPRAYYLNVPHRNQETLPDFDTSELDFSFAQLFWENRFSGADRQADANQLSLALSTRLLDADNYREVFNAHIGQIRYFDDRRVQLSGEADSRSSSAYAGEINFIPDPQWQGTLALQWDPEDDQLDKAVARIQHRFGEQGLINFSYRFQDDKLEQIDSSLVVPLSASWDIIGRWNYSILDEQNLETLLGVKYESCCWATRFVARRFALDDSDAQSEQRNAIYFELELKGLGTLGRKSEAFLQRAILGY